MHARTISGCACVVALGFFSGGGRAQSNAVEHVFSTGFEAADQWVACAAQYATCDLDETRDVRFGASASSSFVERASTGSVRCQNEMFDGIDPAPGRAKSCWYSAAFSRAAPTPASIWGKPDLVVSGSALLPVSGQVIENLHITRVDGGGACIQIPGGVSNVIVRYNEIGRCATADPPDTDTAINQRGILIYSPDSHDIEVRQNVIHDVSVGLYVGQALHPIVFDRNFVYNILGPLWAGQVVQFEQLHDWSAGGGAASRITCNVIDDRWGRDTAVRAPFGEDHVNIGDASGSAAYPLEIAYNRIRGALVNPSPSGSGIMLGDDPPGTANSGWYHVHHNTVVRVENAGISVVGGHDVAIDDNRVENNGPDAASLTHCAFSERNLYQSVCTNIGFSGNHGIARAWDWGGHGEPITTLCEGSAPELPLCAPLTLTDNDFDDTTLDPSIFDQPYAECENP